jgi:hypothetical protein
MQTELILNLMFNIPVGVCFNSHKKTVTANSVCISLFGDFVLKVSACYGDHQAILKNMNIETLLAGSEGLPLHNGAKIYSILYI